MSWMSHISKKFKALIVRSTKYFKKAEVSIMEKVNFRLVWLI